MEDLRLDMIMSPGPCLVPDALDVAEDVFAERSVSYKVTNICDQAVELPVTFKTGRFGYGNVGEDNRGKDYASLKVSVNGQAVELKHEVSAWFEDKNVTAELEKAGVSPNILLTDVNGTNTDKGWRWLIAEEHDLSAERLPGLVATEDGHPNWKTENSYSFTMSFPPGKTTTIRYSHFNVYGFWQVSGIDMTNDDPEQLKLYTLFTDAYGNQKYDRLQYSWTYFNPASVTWEHPIKNARFAVKTFMPADGSTGELRTKPSELGNHHELVGIGIGGEPSFRPEPFVISLKDYKPGAQNIEFIHVEKQLPVQK